MDPTLVQPPKLAEPPKLPESEAPTSNALGPNDPLNVGPKQPGNTSATAGLESANVKNGKKHDGLSSILTTLAILVLAPLIAFALTAFVFQSYQVDGSSMETTLQNQDRLIVLKLPRTIAKITRNTYVPSRYDVVIFNKNDLFEFGGSGQKKQLVKRVIGIPGDRVVVKDNKVTIYNSEHPQGYNPDADTAYSGAITTTPGNVDITVPEGKVFVMGDNRHNSLDSRVFGPISDDEIVGRLILRIFPFNKFKPF